jgi:hypothetical protein
MQRGFAPAARVSLQPTRDGSFGRRAREGARLTSESRGWLDPAVFARGEDLPKTPAGSIRRRGRPEA